MNITINRAEKSSLLFIYSMFILKRKRKRGKKSNSKKEAENVIDKILDILAYCNFVIVSNVDLLTQGKTCVKI